MSLRTRWQLGCATLCLLLVVAASLPAGAAPAGAASAAPTSATAGTAGAVDINEASEDALTAIPGIGEAMAKRIVEFRKQNGPFRQVEDLLKVKGIGEKSLDKLRPHIRVAKGGK